MKFKSTLPIAMVLPWTLLSLGAAPPAANWISLFNGRSIDNWVVKGGQATFQVEEGVIVGTTGPAGGINTFLCTPRDYADFELELEVRTDRAMNSGIQIRSHGYEKDTPTPANPARVRIKGEVYGYQCEIAENDKCTSGNFWDEARWTTWHDDLTKKPGACAAFKPGAWNHFRIVAQGEGIYVELDHALGNGRRPGDRLEVSGGCPRAVQPELAKYIHRFALAAWPGAVEKLLTVFP